jgi:mono/diheme cytochrome c family protein
MIRKYLYILMFVILVAFFVGGCTRITGNTPEATIVPVEFGFGDPKDGLLLFNDHCFECHSTQDGQAIAGPSLFAAGDKFSYAYVKESIQDPHIVVVDVQDPQFEDAEMPKDIVAELSEQELEDIISYVLSQISEAGIKIEK